MREESNTSYEDVVHAIQQWPATMLVGLFVESVRLCLVADVFVAPYGVECMVARIRTSLAREQSTEEQSAKLSAEPSPITAGLINGQFVLLTDDKDYVVADEGVWLTVKGFSVRVVKTDEGIRCDVYAAGKEMAECLASTWALDSLLEAEDAAT